MSEQGTVAGQDDADAGVAKGLVQLHRCPAGVREDHVHAVTFQAADHNLGAFRRLIAGRRCRGS